MVERIQGGASLGEADGIYYLLKDNLGSTTDVVAPDGFLTRTRYTAWGGVLSTTGSLPTDKQYTGQDKSSNSGLYFYQSRWYDPASARFVQPDSIIPSLTNPLDLDRYAYVHNSPVTYNDPSGHIECDDEGECYTPYGEILPQIKNNQVKYGRLFSNPVEMAAANYILSGNKTYLAEIPSAPNTPLTPPSVIVIGMNFSGAMAPLFKTGGIEAVVFLDGQGITFYKYGGEGGFAGEGGNLAAYVGTAWNVKNPDDYNGQFSETGGTVSVGQYGLTGGYFFGGDVKGIMVGWAPGAELSYWWTSTYYQTLFSIK